MSGFERDQRRERFVAAALTGLLANPNRVGHLAEASEAAVHSADFTIAELDKAPTAAEALRRLREIEALVEGEADVDDGTPNLAAKILVIAKGQDRP